ncbi:MAG: hypothetical protein R3C69_05305 [Geminicoccaceae bacterium]
MPGSARSSPPPARTRATRLWGRRLARLVGEVRTHHAGLPVCGIAGIDHGNAAAVIGAGADIAVISDIFMADDVEVATRRLRQVVDAALAGEGR